MLISAILCLSFSTQYHILGVISKKINSFSSRFDYGGISLLIAGSCYPPYYYFFHCDNIFKSIYLCFITIFALCVFFYSLSSDFYLPTRRTFRGILFLILGLSTAIPVFHLIFLNKTITGFMEGPRLIYWYFGGWKRKSVFHISSIKAILTNDKCHLFLNNARVFSNNAGVFCNNTGVLMEELCKRKIPLPS